MELEVGHHRHLAGVGRCRDRLPPVPMDALSATAQNHVTALPAALFAPALLLAHCRNSDAIILVTMDALSAMSATAARPM